MSDASLEFSVKRMLRFDGEGNLKAYVDLGIGNLLVIKGVRVVEGKNGLFVSMPRQQGKDGKWYDNVTIESPVAKQEVGRVVLDAYQQET